MKTLIVFIIIAGLFIGLKMLIDWANSPDPSEYREHYKSVGY